MNKHLSPSKCSQKERVPLNAAEELGSCRVRLQFQVQKGKHYFRFFLSDPLWCKNGGVFFFGNLNTLEKYRSVISSIVRLSASAEKPNSLRRVTNSRHEKWTLFVLKARHYFTKWYDSRVHFWSVPMSKKWKLDLFLFFFFFVLDRRGREAEGLSLQTV